MQNLDLSSSDASYANLVGVPSLCAGIVRVVPNDVDASYLVDKVGADGAFCGAMMPEGLPPLSAQQIELIRGWINQGAPPADGLRFDVSTTKTTRTTRTTHTTNASSTTSTTAAPAG